MHRILSSRLSKRSDFTLRQHGERLPSLCPSPTTIDERATIWRLLRAIFGPISPDHEEAVTTSIRQLITLASVSTSEEAGPTKVGPPVFKSGVSPITPGTI